MRKGSEAEREIQEAMRENNTIKSGPNILPAHAKGQLTHLTPTNCTALSAVCLSLLTHAEVVTKTFCLESPMTAHARVE